MKNLSLPLQLAPLCAPLPVPMLDHLWRRMLRESTRQHRNSATFLQEFVTQVHQISESVFLYMDPFIMVGQQQQNSTTRSKFTTQWLAEVITVQGQKHLTQPYHVTAGTLSHWRRRGVLRYDEHNAPNSESAAALVVARIFDAGERNFLPDVIDDAEPAWWCFRQDTPESAIVPCPVPLGPDVPPTALLWTLWPGAYWSGTWQRIGERLGAAQGRPSPLWWQETPVPALPVPLPEEGISHFDRERVQRDRQRHWEDLMLYDRVVERLVAAQETVRHASWKNTGDTGVNWLVTYLENIEL